jgi:hypothetical protein
MLEVATAATAFDRTAIGQGVDAFPDTTWHVEDFDQLPDEDEQGLFNFFEAGSGSEELPAVSDEELIDLLNAASNEFEPYPLRVSDSEPELELRDPRADESQSAETAGHPTEATETPAAPAFFETKRLDRWLKNQTHLAATVAASTLDTVSLSTASAITNQMNLTRVAVTQAMKPVSGAINKRARKSNDDPRPFHCTYPGCGHKATKRRYLLEHERKHSGERPYKCTWPGCTYAASGQGHISRHIRTHTGDRPYPCTEPGCGYFASQSGHLRTHMRTHTGERPYKCSCDGCDYAAGRPGHLARHMKVHAAAAAAAEQLPDSLLCKAAARPT